MPAYNKSPFPIRQSLLPGDIGYSWGKGSNPNDPGCRMQVTSVAITSNVATLGVKVLEGFAPIVGQLVTVQGTQTATSGGAPNFNVTAASITAISGFNTGDNSTGTISFALSSSNISTTTDAGQAYAPPNQPPTQESLTGTPTAGLQFAVSPGPLATNGQRGVTWFTEYSGSPSAVTANLQGSDVDQDANYTTIDSSTNTAGESRSLANVNYNFLRVQISGSGGSSPTCAAGIAVR